MLSKLVALTALALAGAPSAFAAAGGCHSYSGTYANHNVPCSVVAIACVQSDLTGGLAGTSYTTVTAYDPVTRAFSGTVVIVRANGAELDSTIVGIAGVSALETITGGTREFAHATGTTVVTGSGRVVDDTGTFAGEYCLGVGAHEDA